MKTKTVCVKGVSNILCILELRNNERYSFHRYLTLKSSYSAIPQLLVALQSSAADLNLKKFKKFKNALIRIKIFLFLKSFPGISFF